MECVWKESCGCSVVAQDKRRRQLDRSSLAGLSQRPPELIRLGRAVSLQVPICIGLRPSEKKSHSRSSRMVADDPCSNLRRARFAKASLSLVKHPSRYRLQLPVHLLSLLSPY